MQITTVEEWALVRSGDPDARQRVIAANYGLVRHLAGKHLRRLPPSVNLEDIAAYAAVGLIQAVDNYRPCPVPFAVYATAKIRSAILDELRAQDWAPRSLRRRQRLVAEATQSLTGKLGRDPTDEEVEAVLESAPGEVSQVRRAVHSSHHRSLDECDPDGDRFMADHPTDVCTDVGLQDVTAQFMMAFSAMSVSEQAILTLKYFPGVLSTEKVTLGKVGGNLGLTDGRVSQIHTQAVFKVRDALRESMQGQL